MLKGEVFGRQLFENQIFALFINTFLNGNNGVCSDYLNGMAVTYSGNNVTIDSGAICIQGRFLEEDTSTTLDAGNSNLFCKLVIEIDLDKINTENTFNQGYYKVVTDSNNYPSLIQTDIVGTNSGIYQYELARFKTSSNGITDFQDMRTTLSIPTIYDDIRQMVQDAIDSIEDGSAFVLKTELNGTVLYSNSVGTRDDTINFTGGTISEGDLIEITFGRARVSDGTLALKTTGKLSYFSGMVISLDMLYNSAGGMEDTTKRVVISSTGLTTENKNNDNLAIKEIRKFSY